LLKPTNYGGLNVNCGLESGVHLKRRALTEAEAEVVDQINATKNTQVDASGDEDNALDIWVIDSDDEGLDEDANVGDDDAIVKLEKLEDDAD